MSSEVLTKDNLKFLHTCEIEMNNILEYGIPNKENGKKIIELLCGGVSPSYKTWRDMTPLKFLVNIDDTELIQDGLLLGLNPNNVSYSESDFVLHYIDKNTFPKKKLYECISDLLTKIESEKIFNTPILHIDTLKLYMKNHNNIYDL